MNNLHCIFGLMLLFNLTGNYYLTQNLNGCADSAPPGGQRETADQSLFSLLKMYKSFHLTNLFSILIKKIKIVDWSFNAMPFKCFYMHV